MYNMFQQIEVETKSGFLFTESKTESGLMFRGSDYNTFPRDPMFELPRMYNNVVGPPERMYYGICALFLGNNISRITRDYPSILDTFQNIVGSAEVLVFLFVFFMVLHHDVVMDLYMLNNEVLMNPKNLKDAISKKN